MKEIYSGNLYYGWLILAVCFFITVVSSGSRSSMGVFITPMESDLEWSRSTISRVLSLGIFVGALSYVVIGYLHSRFKQSRFIACVHFHLRLYGKLLFKRGFVCDNSLSSRPLVF